MNRRTHRIIVATAVFLLAFGGQSQAQQETLLSGLALIKALRAGGMNIYFRHAQTDWTQDDYVDKPGDWTSCDPKHIRQLSEEGRQVSRAIGKAMRALSIPVGTVLSSPYCRCVETARLMSLGPVSTTTDIINLRVSHFFGGDEAIVKTARARLAIAPAVGTNTVIVAHGNVAREATPVYPGEAEAVVFRPNSNGGFVLIGRITPIKWAQLAEEFTNGL